MAWLAAGSKSVSEGYNPNPPDLAVEVVSKGDARENDTLTLKLGHYLAVGTVVWIVRPESKTVEVHQPGQPPQILHENGTLTSGDLLPGLSINLGDVFK